MFYLRDIGIFALFFTALLFVSARVWRCSTALGWVEAFALTSGFVLGSCALLLWLCGMFIGVGMFSVLCFLLPCALVLWLCRKPQRSAKFLWESFSFVEKLLAFYLAIVFAITFVLCLAPPVGNDYDSLVYHLAAPAQYLRSGKIVALPYDHHTFFPFATEMLFLLGLKLSGAVGAKLFHWLMLPLCCAAIYAIGARHASRRSGLLGAALFASIPLVQSEATTAYIDLALVAFTLLAFLTFAHWSENLDRRWLLLCGVFCGFCLGTKYFGLLPLFWFAASANFVMISRRKWRAKPLFSMLGLALLFGGGWYVRNFLATGNPVFPFAYSIFGGRGWTAQMAAQYAEDVGKFGFGKSPLDLAWLPWRLSMTPLNVGSSTGTDIVGLPFWPISYGVLNNGQSGLFEVRGLLFTSFLGPALLAFGAPLLLAQRKPQIVRFAGWSVLFFFAVWAFSSQTIRYLLPAFGLICIACGWGIELYAKRSAILKWTSCGFFVAWICCTPMLTLWQNRAVLPVALGQRAPEDFLSKRFAAFDAMQWSSQNTPTNARFAVYGEPRCFYLQRDYFWADAAHNTLIEYSKINDAKALVAALKAQGATHVLWNAQPEQNAGFGSAPPHFQEAIAQGMLRQIFERKGYVVFQIVAP